MARITEDELIDFCIRIAEYVEEENMPYAVILARKAIEPDPVEPVPPPPPKQKKKGRGWNTDEWGG